MSFSYSLGIQGDHSMKLKRTLSLIRTCLMLISFLSVKSFVREGGGGSARDTVSIGAGAGAVAFDGSEALLPYPISLLFPQRYY